ncbi:uridine kinase family protein [Paenibacillus gansuensis]|uniref:Uridine kinase n=1 Tax=Paenibacillus gansuensis TaxID=306542 RepID=A0ABW5PLA6_9BACL
MNPTLLHKLSVLTLAKPLTIIGIDGCGGSGKSTLARQIAEQFSGTTIVHMDDFYRLSADRVQLPADQKPIAADYDWPRLHAQVLTPLAKGNEARYQRYDWPSDSLAEEHTVPAKGLVVIEGVYSTLPELARSYGLTVWVDCPRELRLERGLQRDGEEARKWWEDWMAAEDRYVKLLKPQEKADVLVEGV